MTAEAALVLCQVKHLLWVDFSWKLCFMFPSIFLGGENFFALLQLLHKKHTAAAYRKRNGSPPPPHFSVPLPLLSLSSAPSPPPSRSNYVWRHTKLCRYSAAAATVCMIRVLTSPGPGLVFQSLPESLARAILHYLSPSPPS